MTPHLRGAVIALVLLGAGCRDREVTPAGAGKVELIEAPAAIAIAPVVAGEVVRARADGKQLIVYVGAAWCEPCKYFHDAVTRGELDAGFPTLRLLAFDADRDQDALQAAGYDASMIPLFAVPAADGTPSAQRMQGSIKGPGAVAEITPRLRALLAAAAAR